MADAPLPRDVDSAALTVFAANWFVRLSTTLTVAAVLSVSLSLVLRGEKVEPFTWMVFRVSLTPLREGFGVAAGGDVTTTGAAATTVRPVLVVLLPLASVAVTSTG